MYDTTSSALENTFTSDNHVEQTKQYKRQARVRSDLAKAIKANQFRVHYQPEIDLETNEILAAEAFIRWEHPQFGTLLPNEFITIAEESDFILEMGDWILNTICHDYSEWLREGLSPIKVSINYSSIQFLQEDFVDNICATTKKHNLKPDFIIIEILERVSISNFDQIRNNIDKLHKLGIEVALDDFGTGFSSLEYLSKLNVDIIKIDKLFTQTAPSDLTNAFIVEAILSLARKLGIKAVAEGIETSEQLNFLISKNCSVGQGYYFDKPMPAKEYKKLLRKKICSPGKSKLPSENELQKRNYSRFRFPLYLQASMTILKHRGNDVNYGTTRVLIRDIGAGGLCFYSTMHIPVMSNILISFTTTLLGRQIAFYGTPVWSKEVNRHLYKYGIKFDISDGKKSVMDATVHQLKVEMEKNDGAISGDFVRQAPCSYFEI